MLDRITPVVKHCEASTDKVILGKLGDPRFRITYKNLLGELSNNAVSELVNALSARMNIKAKDSAGELEIELSISSDIPSEVTKNAEQAYKITAEADEIRLIGYGEAGLYYAVNTFLQTVECVNNNFVVPKMTIIDFPDLKTRGHFLECRFGSNLMTLDDWKAVVDDMADMKLNQLVVALYGCWSIQYDDVVSEYIYIKVPNYPLLKKDVYKKYYSPKKGGWVDELVEVPMAKEDFFGELVKYGKSRGVEVFPLWNSLGHNTLIPQKYPEVAPIVDGERSKLGFCTTNPKTYELMFHIYDTIIDKYLAPNGVKSFHIGLDEVHFEGGVDINDRFRRYSPWCECENCSKFTDKEKMTNYTIKLISHLKDRGIENVYMYNDIMTGMFKDTEGFRKALEDADLLDVTVMNWWDYSDSQEFATFSTTYPELKIRATVKPWNGYYHWSVIKDATVNIKRISEMAYKENCEGLQSYSAWDKTSDINHVAMADYSWNFVGTGTTDEYRERYARRNFPTSLETAKEAFDIFYQFTRDGQTLPSENDPTVSCNLLVREVLGYYKYSYVRSGFSYPRNFPGDAFKKLLDVREALEPQMKEFSALTDKAYRLFEELRRDNLGNYSLAQRYSAEVRNHRDTIDDYLALFEIYDIMGAGKSEAAKDKIRDIARARKLNRLDLIREMESFKEEYLHASHLRNQSIFMQFFADLEAYCNETPTEDFELDVLDMSNIGSKTFYYIR